MQHRPTRDAAVAPAALATVNHRHSYLLRVQGGLPGPCYLLQDLGTGERHWLVGQAELQQFLLGCKPVQRLR